MDTLRFRFFDQRHRNEILKHQIPFKSTCPRCRLIFFFFFLGHCSFFLISSNLTFGKSEINYVSFPNERLKKLVYDFKVSLARLWHGTLQRERKITLHTWSIKKKPLKWIAGWDPVWHKSWHWWHSPWAQGYLAWTRRLLGPYQWALAHPLGAPKPCRLKKNWWGWQHIWACYGFYFSQKQPPMLSPSLTGTAASVGLTEMIGLHKEREREKNPPAN